MGFGLRRCSKCGAPFRMSERPGRSRCVKCDVWRPELPEERFVYRTERWRRTSRVLREEADHKCQLCGATGVRLEVDHIVPIRKDPSKAFDSENLQVVCVPCHRKEESKRSPRAKAYRKQLGLE